MKKYGFRDWDSVLAAIGHGGLKEGQVVNRLQEEYEKKHKKELTDEQILDAIAENKGNKEQKTRAAKNKSGVIVKGMDGISIRFSRCCSPVPGDEIIGFVTRGRGASIHRTDCINIINLPEIDRARILEAEWQDFSESEQYQAGIKIFANNRTGILADISKIFTERQIDVKAINSRTSKQGTATISLEFEIHGKEELGRLIDKLRNVESVIEIERISG